MLDKIAKMWYNGSLADALSGAARAKPKRAQLRPFLTQCIMHSIFHNSFVVDYAVQNQSKIYYRYQAKHSHAQKSSYETSAIGLVNLGIGVVALDALCAINTSHNGENETENEAEQVSAEDDFPKHDFDFLSFF